MKKIPRPLILHILFACLSTGIIVQAQKPTAQELDRAVMTLRNIEIEKLSEKEQNVKAAAIDEAWKELISAGEAGSVRLKQEIAALESSKVADDFFKLNAAVVLWQIGKEAEAKVIGDLWSRTPVSAQYNYVFYTAMEAARTKRAEVLPMLKAVLKDEKGNLFFASHAMRVTWPLTHEFIWGTYGPKGLPALNEILERSEDPVEIASAMTLLTQAQYLPSLPRIRQLAADKRDAVRWRAIKALGIFGHPEDYELLIKGLPSAKGMEAFFYAFALYEFDDERAVPHLIPLLKAEEEPVKREVMLALLRLLTPASFAAVKQEVSTLPDGDLKRFMNRSITLRKEKLPQDFDSKTPEEQAALLDEVRNRDLRLGKDARKATNQQVLDAAKEWAAKGRIYDSGFEWVGIPQLIAAGTPGDIETLLEAKSAFYPRLSDECLYETKDIDTAIKYIGRSRYRKGVGVTSKAELK